MKIRSLRRTFSWVTLASLLVFSFVLAFILDRTFHRSLLETQQDRLISMVYSLLASVEESPNGGLIVEDGLISRDVMESDQIDLVLLTAQGVMLWQKETDASIELSKESVDVGQWHFSHDFGLAYGFAMKFVFEWQEAENLSPSQYTIVARETADWYYFERNHFRQTLAIWFVLGCLALFLIQRALLQIGFRPLKNVAQEVAAIEQGEQQQFRQDYPKELEPLTQGINSLLRHERQQQIRFRQALDNLAHALKTPLSAVSNMAQNRQVDDKFWDTLTEQINRADAIVAHQLQKAATVGKTAFTQPQLLLPAVEKVSRALQKVYAEKNLDIAHDGLAHAQWLMDESDMMELIGNVMENAAKYGRHWIGISWEIQDGRPLLHIEDDGPGFEASTMPNIVVRGLRQDQQLEGQGLGLTLAHEIVSLLDGYITFGRSSRDGAKVSIHIPS